MCWRKKKKSNGLKHFVRADTLAAVGQSGGHVIILPYQCRLSCYLKGESPRSGNFTVHFLYPLTVNNFPFFKSSHNFLIADFPRPLALSLSFSGRCVTESWFSHHARRRTGSVSSQNRSLSLFPLLAQDHRAKFNTNNKITGAQKYSLPHTEGFNLTSRSYLYLTTLMYL